MNLVSSTLRLGISRVIGGEFPHSNSVRAFSRTSPCARLAHGMKGTLDALKRDYNMILMNRNGKRI